jgi:16S rRNA G966 N2-methylase RsmD
VRALAGKADITPISQPIAPRKQAARRHWGSHSYFTKRAWNVVQAYIETFSDPGEVVLDPFGGSGVTAVEALVLRRRAIHVDLAPFADLIAWGIAVSPVDEKAFQTTFGEIRSKCEQSIQDLYKLDEYAIDAMAVPHWYPKDVPLPPNSDVPTVEACFHRRSLIALSILLHQIEDIPDQTLRELYRLVFAATLTKTNLTFSSTTGRKASRGDSGIFRVYRYWVPKKTVELNVWEQFELRYQGWLDAKRETNELIGDYYDESDTIRIVQASATDLTDVVESESVDYIYTDPPYGAHIAYLDLMTMWNAWLRLPITEEARKEEVIEGGSLDKSKAEYIHLLEASITEMFRVLKWDSWLSIVFAHKEPAFWDAIVKAAQSAGFEYVNSAVQPSTTPSLHKRKNPLNVLSGELVLNFRKVKSPRSIAISAVGQDVVRLIKNTAELVIVRRQGASTEDIYNDLIPVLLENGLLGEVRTKITDITKLLGEDFDIGNDGRWYIRPNKRLGSFVPLGDRIRFYLVDYLRRRERDGDPRCTFDDIVFHVMPNLVNGTQPTRQSLLDVLSRIAYSTDGKHWELRPTLPGLSTDVATLFSAPQLVPEIVAAADPAHDEIIYRLAKLAAAARVHPHVGKKEQSAVVYGERLGDIGGGAIPGAAELEKWMRGKIEQIDCVFYDDTGVPLWGWEVEASTPITTGIDRFLELLKVNPELARRIVIIIPRKRKKKLDDVLRSSHYIGHPLYMENKLGYLYYEDLLRIYDAFAGKKAPTWDALRIRLEATIRTPQL